MAMLLAAAVLVVAAAGAGAQEAAVVATRVEGDVEVQLPDEGGDEWHEIGEGDVVPLAAQIATGFESEAELAVGENAIVTAGSLTRMSVDDLVEEEGVERSEISLDVGRIDGEVDRTEERPTEFEVSSEVATASVRGTSFSFDGERLSVGDGQVAIIDMYGREVSVYPAEESASDGVSRPDPPREQRRQASRVSPYTERGGGESTPPAGTTTETVVVDPGVVVVVEADW